MKKIDFSIFDSSDNESKMSLIFEDDNPRPYISYNDNKYEGFLPGEVFKGEKIKNPKPLPKKTYGFIVDDFIFVYQKNILGNSFVILNPGFITNYKNKNILELIIQILIGIALIAIIAYAITTVI